MVVVTSRYGSVIVVVLILVVVVGGRLGMVVVEVILLELAVGPVIVRWGRRTRSRVMTLNIMIRFLTNFLLHNQMKVFLSATKPAGIYISYIFHHI